MSSDNHEIQDNIKSIDSIIQPPFSIAEKSDIKFLKELEKESFEEYRRESNDTIRRSITSDNQIVIVAKDAEGIRSGSITLRKYKRKIRIMSIAVKRNAQGKNLGKALLEKAIECGRFLEFKRLTLEADANDNRLIRWYESFGFEQVRILENYYGPKKHAIKMELFIHDPNKYIAVTDFDTDFFDGFDNVIGVRATDYFEDEKYQHVKDVRVFNFCAKYKYQSVGYYVSLLALARNQVAYPSAGLLRDIDNYKVIKSIGEEIDELIQESFSTISENEITVNSYFGKSDIPEFQKLINSLKNLYPSPLMRYHFVKRGTWSMNRIKVLALKETLNLDYDLLKSYAREYFSDKRFIRSSLKRYKYYMAILVDPDEKLPPSDKEALDRFGKAAELIGFYVEYITKKDFSRIPEFDALFIRTTTNVNDYTYDFSRYAYAEGLVVIDDPWSILRCANKIYLFEALRNAKVNMPGTWVINCKSKYKNKLRNLSYPLILKLPDSAFSAGVYKVRDETECLEKLKEMFKRSELIVAQEYMPTEYDWRIGILDGRFLYACKYYMAKNHWQIVSWENGAGDIDEGGYESVDESDVPQKVLDAALKSASIIGDGLYGVDIKVKGRDVYVIEVNDNPNIDHMVEDAVDGDNLYKKIILSFYNRLESNTKILRTIC
ncbi:Glutathione synthase/RimK-type ligase, ATP-grasp superfamily [Dethiosulfatibacter aminovorans DSM 17477]|uniref:Glutathione synthase/RimK-type ligase, ATP-grasp superfamily n=1 Tax=Dethiosulfatibacter aminovorans DSM 17477 TaxID=1121476 RepID=A0A1M6AR17_9FIRM|nr:GNAT family N-acetyltransferase [Dethiosulfatibacter aminovorans]SHI38881.1 Glutathione synthase/RimK-type ligase, ATP-grasp superfamily [Dethiosulfatibacter aminovorans DSM 17477]